MRPPIKAMAMPRTCTRRRRVRWDTQSVSSRPSSFRVVLPSRTYTSFSFTCTTCALRPTSTLQTVPSGMVTNVTLMLDSGGGVRWL